MRYKNFILRIIKFGLIAGSFFSNSRLLAENLKPCLKDYSPKTYRFEKNQGIIISVRKQLRDVNNNESLREHLALLKLNAVEEYSKAIGEEVSSTTTKYGGTRYNEKFNTSWDFMKESIASMEEIGICVKKPGLIIFSARWAPKSVAVVEEIIKLENAWDKLDQLAMEDPKFNSEGFDKLDKKYPNIFTADDPEIILEAIDHWKKYRRF